MIGDYASYETSTTITEPVPDLFGGEVTVLSVLDELLYRSRLRDEHDRATLDWAKRSIEVIVRAGIVRAGVSGKR